MASFSPTQWGDAFPVGTVVSVYPGGTAGANGPARGAAVTSATVASDGSLSFSGLTADTPYVAHAPVGSGFRAIRFRVSDSIAAQGRAIGTVDTTSGSATVTATVTSGALTDGMRFTATGIPAGTFIDTMSGTGPYTVVLTDKATANGTGVAFDAYGANKWKARLRARRAALGTS